MNVKVRMPKFGVSKKPNAQRGWVKELLLSVLATSISIVLTFGTAYQIERHQKMAAQRQMAMMIIHDIDETINQMEVVDSLFRDFRDEQFKILEGKYDKYIKLARVDLIKSDPKEVKFAETTERIFTSNVDTWSTIGKAEFIDNVSRCYIKRAEFQEKLIDAFHMQVNPKDNLELLPLDEMLAVDADYYVAYASEIINFMKMANELNKRIMGISDKDLDQFTSHITGLDEAALDSLRKDINEEFLQNMLKKEAAMENYLKNKDSMYAR